MPVAMPSREIWLRAETKADESRAPLSPADAGTLIEAGFGITVEADSGRCFKDSEYQNQGCTIAAAGSWREAAAHTLVLGLKELPDDNSDLSQRHIYFAHAYKQQPGWEQVLRRFNRGGGELLDLEYLVDDEGRRLAAFGYWAGYAGAAVAVLAWAGQRLGRVPALRDLTPYAGQSTLLQHCQRELHLVGKTEAGVLPSIIIIGAKGRVGSGAAALANQLALPVTAWDLQETRGGGPFAAILDHTILVNCVLLNEAMPPFITPAMLAHGSHRLRVIADVSCDPGSSHNPLPLYERCSSFREPLIALPSSTTPLDLIAIDNLPALLPREASTDFSTQLLPLLLALAANSHPVWQRASNYFHSALSQVQE